MQKVIAVYHGSNCIVQTPEIRPVSRPMDFGVGFYLTTLPAQAVEWAQKKALAEKGTPIVSRYNLNIALLKKDPAIKSFIGTSDNWLDFILKHRKVSAYNHSKIDINGKQIRRLTTKPKVHHGFDAVMGEVADDDVFDAIYLYESKIISREELRRRLRTKRKNDQICLCTTAALDYLNFTGTY